MTARIGVPAYNLIQQGRVPVGVVYKEEARPSFDQRLEQSWEKTQTKSVEELMKAFEF